MALGRLRDMRPETIDWMIGGSNLGANVHDGIEEAGRKQQQGGKQCRDAQAEEAEDGHTGQS